MIGGSGIHSLHFPVRSLSVATFHCLVTGTFPALHHRGQRFSHEYTFDIFSISVLFKLSKVILFLA